MGTANFYNKNASRVFAVMTGEEQKYCECEECGEKHFEWEADYTEATTCECGGEITHETEYTYPEDWQWDDNFQNLQDRLGELEEPFEVTEEDYTDNERNFCGRTFAHVYLRKFYGDFEVGVRVKCIRRSAYYEGACLDWEADFQIEGDDWGDRIFLGDLVDEFESYFENRGMAKIQSRYAKDWLESAWTRAIEAVEKKFAESCGIELVKVAQFSNGEAIYQKAS